MKYIIGIFAILVFVGSLAVWSQSKSAVHEILAAVLLCYSGVLMLIAIVIDCTDVLKKAMTKDN